MSVGGPSAADAPEPRPGAHRLHELTDLDRHEEIELVGRLVAAAVDVDRPLTQDEIDDLLGVQPRRHPGAGPADAAH